MAMVSSGATSSTIRTLVTAAVKFPKSETKGTSILRIITSAVTRHEKDSLVADFGRHKLHEGQKMICCRSLGTSAAMTAEEHTSRQYFAVVYDYVPDILERRGQYRAEHLALANQLVDEGKVLLGGAWGSPVDGALLIFYVHNIKEVQRFIDKDPYVRNGLVTKVDIRPYAVAVGSGLQQGP
ncbi:unnamed protein product [Sphagnum tenellum]